MIVIVFGLPGSGKSYFASRLAKMINAGYVNSDKIRKEIFSKRTYSAQEKAAVYNVMLLKMKEASDQNKNLVLDATFHKNDMRQLFLQAIKSSSKILFIEVWAAENIVKDRLKENRPYSDADYDVYKLIRQDWEPLNAPHLLLESTNENIDSMLQEAAAYLQGKYDKRTNQ